jgi:hypothetical protein
MGEQAHWDGVVLLIFGEGDGADERTDIGDEGGATLIEKGLELRHSGMKAKLRVIGCRVTQWKKVGRSEGEFLARGFVFFVGGPAARCEHVEGVVAAVEEKANERPVIAIRRQRVRGGPPGEAEVEQSGEKRRATHAAAGHLTDETTSCDG